MTILFFQKKSFLNKAWLACFLLYGILSAVAGNITFNNYIRGSAIAASASVPVQDQEFFKIQAGIQDFTDYNLVNLVRLSYRGTDKTAAAFAAPASPWSLTVTYSVKFYDNNNQVITSQTLLNQTLVVSHAGSGGGINKDIDIQKIAGVDASYKFEVDVTSISLTGISGALSNDFYLETEINTDRYYNLVKPLSAYAAPALKAKDPSDIFQPITASSINSTSGTKYSELQFSWPFIKGAEEYEVEWVYAYYDIVQSGTPSAPLTPDFSKAARVTTPENFYAISLLYEQGYIFYRYRPVSRKISDLSQPLQGDWSNAGAILIETPHDATVNWTYGAAYAEGGKKKEVASYFDYSLRKRQAVTRNNSNNTSIVSETMYDFEGRPAINVLPTVPSAANEIKYYSNYSLSGTAPFDKTLFGSVAARAATQKYANLDGGGAGNYYKSKTADMAENFLPDAENVPYTQTVYNNEGQVKTQTGLGPLHALGSGHESSFFYASPSQFKLDRLFGNEIGSVKYYKLKVDRDANGQTSYTYLNQLNKPIATSLVNDPLSENGRTLLEPLSSNSQMSIVDSWDDTEIYDPSSETWENKKPFFVSTAGVYNFTVNVNNTAFSHCSGSHNCEYDLQITISDPCGTQITESSPGSPSILNTIHTFNVSAGVQQYIFSINFTEPGTYSLTKKLSLNQAYLQSEADAYKATLINGTSECVIPGLAGINSGLTGGTDVSGCTECTETSPCPETEDCGLLLDILEKDLKPLGQYAENLPLGTTTASNTWLTTWVWNSCSNPENPAACLTSAVWLNAGFYNTYGTLVSNWSDYKTNFDNSFLTSPFLNNTTSTQTQDPPGQNNYDNDEFESLVEFHPEYCHYEWCQLISPSRTFDANLSQLSSTAAEGSTYQFLNSSSPYMTSTTISNILAADPFFHSGTTALTFHPTWSSTTKSLAISSTVLSSMTAAINSGYYDPSSSVISMWQQACYVITGNTSPSSLTTLQLEKTWRTFVSYYEYEKLKITEQYKVNTFGCPYLYDADADGYADAPVTTYTQPQLEIFNKSTGFAIRVVPPVTPSIPTLQGSSTGTLQDYSEGICSFNSSSFCEQLASCSISYSGITLSSSDVVKITCELPSGCTPVTLPTGMTPIPNPIIADVTDNTSGGFTIGSTSTAWTDIANNINNYACPSLTYGYTLGSNTHDGFKVVACVDNTAHTITFYPTPGQGADFNGTVLKLYVNGSLISISPSTFSGGMIDKTSAACSASTDDLNCFCAQIAELEDDYTHLSTADQSMYASAADYAAQTLNESYGVTITATDINNWSGNCASSKTNTTYEDADNWPGQTPETVNSYDANTNTVSLTQTVPQALRCYEFSDPCQQDAATINSYYGDYFFQQNVDNAVQQFVSDFKAHCLGQDTPPPAFTQHTIAGYQDSEYQYTLYYYDQAGNLTRTVPPKGVKPLSNTDAVAAASYRNNGTGSPVLANHAGRNLASLNASSGQLTRTYNTNTTASNSSTDPNVNLCDATAGSYHYNTLVTSYVYNSYNQLIAQTTPDAGTSTFWYDKKGKLTVSQNEEQYLTSANAPSSGAKADQEYSYTVYDEITRITEVGKMRSATASGLVGTSSFYPFNAPSGYTDYLLSFVSSTSLAGYLTDPATAATEITKTFYDNNQMALAEGLLGYFEHGDQLNTRNRVTATERYSDPTHKEHSMFYSYDEHGNVKELVQKTALLHYQSGNLSVKKVAYDYDLVSGKVNRVTYQQGERDQMIHRYSYDAENRLTTVYTSKDGLVWDRDADYFYYKHGPLARTEIGDKKVQGLDYAYTIQGWIKGVNNSLLDRSRDPGRDAFTQNSSSFSYNSTYQAMHQNMGKDAMGYALQYFTGDYKPVSDSKYSASADRVGYYFLPSLPGSSTTYGGFTQNLYNGNISAMATGIYTGAGFTTASPLLMAYSYDQLNRIVKQNAFFDAQTGTGTGDNSFTGSNTHSGEYKMSLSYDAMGNITHLLRNGITSGTHVDMDDLTYHYQGDNAASTCFPSGTTSADKELNRLSYVENNAPYTQNQSFVHQASANYKYDAIGNLGKDPQEGIDTITWDVYGKIKTIVYQAGFNRSGNYPPNLHYIYDAAGQRICRISTPRSASGVETDSSLFTYDYYVRDAQGNVMAVYRAEHNSDNDQRQLSLSERHIYGSSRLGIDQLGRMLDYDLLVLANNGFDSNTESWTTNSIATQDAATQRLKVQATTQYSGPDLVLTTTAGKTYDVSYQFDKSDNPTDNIYAEVFDGTSGTVHVLQPQQSLQGSNYLSFTAQSGHSRLRITKGNATGTSTYYIDNVLVKQQEANRYAGNKVYELSNHLGNVLATVSDNKTAIAGSGGVIDHYEPEMMSSTDYYAFGEAMPGRQLNATTYRYGFNGKENDNGVHLDASGMPVVGSQQDYGMRIYNASLCKFLSVDPLTSDYPWYTPYQFAGNRPIDCIDLDGGEPKKPGTSGEWQSEYQYDNNGNSIGNEKHAWEWNSSNSNWDDLGVPAFKDFDANVVKQQIDARLQSPQLIAQENSGLCGVAALATTLAKNDPEGYANLVKDLYLKGTAKYNNYEVTPDDHVFNTSGLTWYYWSNMKEADWILLSSMRDSENSIFDYGDESFQWSQNTAAINFPGEIKSIADKMGFKTTSTMSKISSGGDVNSLKVIDGCQNTGGTVIMLINGGMIKESTWSLVPDHYVVYKGNLSIDYEKKTVSFDVWSWGRKNGKSITTTFESFRDNYYGSIYIRK